MDELPELKTVARKKAEAHLAAANRCYRDKSLVEAIAEFQQAVEADPNFQKARDHLGYTRQEKEDIEAEIPEMRAKIDALTDDLTMDENLQERNQLALFYYLVGQNEEARAEWEWVVRHGSGNAQKIARKRLRQYLQIMPLTAAILAGGQSQRMGTDKAALEIGGMTLLERTARLALAAGLPVLVVGRVRPDGWALPEVRFIPDAKPGLGPAGGLAAALHHAQTAVLALACDLPLLTEEALHWLMAQVRSQFAPSGLVTVNGDRREPLFAVYDLTCLPLTEARLAEGRRSLRGIIEAGQFAFAPAPDWVAAQLVNVNTPDEWRQII